jgi:hypothetical protein
MRFVWQSGVILILPILIWNIFLYPYLPTLYQTGSSWSDFPESLSLYEDITRVLTFALATLLVIDYSKSIKTFAHLTYIMGVLFYFGSWIMVIVWPGSYWSKGILGFSAPAWSAIVWLFGIGLMSSAASKTRNLIRISYFILVTLFMILHTYHAIFAYKA